MRSLMIVSLMVAAVGVSFAAPQPAHAIFIKKKLGILPVLPPRTNPPPKKSGS
jgi:hypothetical protein